MGVLEGRVVVVTGGGRGLGREYALLAAAEGARVVVNDVGSGPDGAGADEGAAASVAREVAAMGGQAVASTDDVADWAGAKRLVDQALERFGRLDGLVLNAGILRDRMLVNLSEEDWDEVVRVHLKGHVAPLHHAAAHWRAEAKAGRTPDAAVVTTTSTSGLLGNPGQANYGAAKAGIAALTVIAARELVRYGVRVNSVAPAARTRLTEQTPGLTDIVRPPADPEAFDVWDPANVAPLVVALVAPGSRLSGQVFFVQGGTVRLFQPWTMTETLAKEGRWSVEELLEVLPGLAGEEPGAPS
jgi:NAD(P)-dependent dehydrogenase (short-subunit alcohol dehydrogenase family)